MCSFREGPVRESRLLKTNSTLPFLFNQDSNSDVVDKCFDIQKRKVHPKNSYHLTF